MIRLSCLLVSFLLSSMIHAQSLKKVPVSNSGCSVYTYCDFKFEKEYSQDSSLVFVTECVKDEVGYGVICVKLLQPITDLDKAEGMLIDYLDYLKSSFKITKSAGYGKGHKLSNNENTRGVLDYWEDSKKNNWKVKAWTDGKFIAVLYGYSLKELPETKLNVFLDSFRFFGM
ncbi:MAG TPA: hypothetical protein VN451_01080 [Chitinophagaceae bacterium]|nr:hypothetical protein [Chitinophagaceae bacterium]